MVFFFQAEDGIRDYKVTGVQTCALPISTTRSKTVIDGPRNSSTGVPMTTTTLVARPTIAASEDSSSRPLGSTERSSSRSEEHTSELQSPCNLVCRLLLEKKKRCQRAVHQ